MFQADQGTTSACNDACATQWPPLVNASPKAGKGTKASLLSTSTSTRADGKTQVVYNGHPVYTFLADKKAGATTGQGLNAFGGLWFALTSAGNQVTKTASSGGGGSGGTSGTPGH